MNRKNVFLTFNMKKCYLLFVAANIFLSEISQISIYITKCITFMDKCKTSFGNSNIMWTKYSTEA